MAVFELDIQLEGDEKLVQKVRARLSNRTDLHGAIASTGGKFTQKYVSGLSRHATAKRLGASPTGHHKKAAKSIESEGTAEEAVIRIPRNSGLTRAFYDFELTPGAGKKWLAIPNDARTYGKSPREFGDAFRFVSFGGRHHALVWKDGPSKGEVAYWLKKIVFIPKDRTLLPSDEALLKVASLTTRKYILGLVD